MESNSHSPAAVSSTVHTRLPIGSVIRTFVEDTNPPKTKLFVIVGYHQDDMVTIYFNSEINQFINYSPELQSLHLPFEAENRGYLKKDCYCDCSTIRLRKKDNIFKIVGDDPALCVGNVSDADMILIMATLRNSPKLKGAHKKRYGFYDF